MEHDEDTMRAADYIVDIGPGAGEHGGEVVAAGTAEEIMKNARNPLQELFERKIKIPVPEDQKAKGYLTSGAGK